MFVEKTPAELRREIKSVMLSTPQHVAVSALDAIGDPVLWHEDAFGLPTLAIYAKVSDLPPDNEDYLRQLFPNLEYEEWEGCGHFLFMEQPERFNKVLSEFLAKQL
jgi:pimeloyl-ACP methyl ester carboxylesterase